MVGWNVEDVWLFVDEVEELSYGVVCPEKISVSVSTDGTLFSLAILLYSGFLAICPVYTTTFL